MAVRAVRVPAHRRSWAVIALVTALVFLGVTAVFGGIELVFDIWGTTAFPSDWVDQLPLIDSWVVPGLVLGIGFGVGSLVVAYGLVRRPRWAWLGRVERLTGYHWAWSATILVGVGLMAWITLEVIYLPARSWLEALYAAIGILLPVLAWHRRVRAYLRADARI
jgi:hypothetical protein